MGAQFHVALSIFDDVAAVRDWLATVADCDIWLTSPHAGIDCFDDDFALAGNVLVMGNEAAGTGNVEGARHVNIPMPGTAESLNVAQATTVLLFEAVRRGIL
jgi:TrmH family RNA methyltransferase